MATEVSCGQCQGRLLVETLGIVVACPHCGTHLSIPAPEPAPVAAPPPPQVMPTPVPVPPVPSPVELQPAGLADFAAHVTASAGVGETAAAANDDPSVFGGADDHSSTPAQIGWHSAPNLFLSPDFNETPAAETAIAQSPLFTAPAPEPAAAAVVPPPPAPTPMTFAPAPMPAPPAAPQPTMAELPPSSSQQFVFGAAATAPIPAPAPTPSPPMQFSPPVPSPPVFGAAPAANALTFGAAPASAAPAGFPTFSSAPAQPRPSAPAGAASAGVPTSTVAQDAAGFADSEFESRQKFLTILLFVVGSYASAVTIVLIYMVLFGRTSALESLPDLKPPTNKNGDISWQYNPPTNDLAPDHVLSLGQSRRFGSVRVTPIKVTRGPVKFEHYSGKEGMARAASDPVLKLWVKFENVSRDQSFIPLDPWMLFTRKNTNLGQSVQANGFVATDAERRKGKPLCYIFDMPIHSENRIVGQNLSRELNPGDSVETFVPSEPDAGSLSGKLVWRFQFRKGYNPRSQRGVTTLIDVRFNSSDIKEERG